MDNYTAINFVVADNIFDIKIGTLGITWQKKKLNLSKFFAFKYFPIKIDIISLL